jgi:tetratricopeptide (TPR) repeat protein
MSFTWLGCLLYLPATAQETNRSQPPQQLRPASQDSALLPLPQPAGPSSAHPSDLDARLLEYEKLLSEDAKQHREFTELLTSKHREFVEDCYKYSLALLSIMGVVATFLHFTSKKEINEAVSAQVKAHADKEIRAKLEAVMAEADREMRNFKNTIDDHAKALQQQCTDLHSISKLAGSLARAAVLLNRPVPIDPKQLENDNRERQDVIEQLAAAKKSDPSNRTIVVFIGRLYRQLGNLDLAIAALDDTIKERINLHQDSGPDYSDVLFNKACYLNQKAKQAEDEMVKEALRAKAWQTLADAIRACPANLPSAEADGDFEGITNGTTRTWQALRGIPKNH